jgi:hypothetical protein
MNCGVLNVKYGMECIAKRVIADNVSRHQSSRFVATQMAVD